MKTLLAAGGALALTIGGIAVASDPAHWSYAGGEGPTHWGTLSPEWALCSTGRMQSPIDLDAPNARGHVEVVVGYRAAPLTILNNGHTIQASFPAGSHLVSSGERYRLLQLHFHTPAEHAITGRRYPLEAHFVHANEQNALAVLGVFFEEGGANPELDKLIAAAPKTPHVTHSVGGMQFDADGLIPGELSVYRYMGSLTTPPCTEGVNWHLAMKPMTASREQLDAMRALMGDNARPVQHRNHRLLVSD